MLCRWCCKFLLFAICLIPVLTLVSFTVWYPMLWRLSLSDLLGVVLNIKLSCHSLVRNLSLPNLWSHLHSRPLWQWTHHLHQEESVAKLIASCISPPAGPSKLYKFSVFPFMDLVCGYHPHLSHNFWPYLAQDSVTPSSLSQRDISSGCWLNSM